MEKPLGYSERKRGLAVLAVIMIALAGRVALVPMPAAAHGAAPRCTPSESKPHSQEVPALHHTFRAGSDRITCHGQEALVGSGALRGIHRNTDPDLARKRRGRHGCAVWLGNAG